MYRWSEDFFLMRNITTYGGVLTRGEWTKFEPPIESSTKCIDFKLNVKFLLC